MNIRKTLNIIYIMLCKLLLLFRFECSRSNKNKFQLNYGKSRDNRYDIVPAEPNYRWTVVAAGPIMAYVACKM